MVRQYVPMKLESGKVLLKLEHQPWVEHGWELEGLELERQQQPAVSLVFVPLES